MQTKLFEVRDNATFMPMIATRLCPDRDHERWLLSRAGFGRYSEDQGQYVLFGPIGGGAGYATTDVYQQKTRTRQVAHEYILKNWDSLVSGEVIDVEFILGETTTKKVTEREDF